MINDAVKEQMMIADESAVWRKHAPMMYDVAMEKELTWPSLTVQWLPGTTASSREGWQQHRLLLGTHTSEGTENSLMVATVQLPASTTELDNRGGGFGKDTVEIVKTFPHPGGEVNRARYMPQCPRLVATKSSSAKVYLYDLEKAEGPLLELEGHDAEGFGICWNPSQKGDLLSGGFDGHICIWDVSNHASSSEGASPAKRSKPSNEPKRKIMNAHDAVGDVSFSFDGLTFASVGDDRRLALWDARTAAETPVSCVVDAHKSDIYSVAMNPYASRGYWLATGSADKTVKLWDTRSLKEPVHVTESHDADVVMVQWAPFEDLSAILATCSEDRRVHIIDYDERDLTPKPKEEKKEEEEEEEAPELFFSHGGHVSKVSDFGWSPDEAWLFASVADDNSLQVWWPANDTLFGDGEISEDSDDKEEPLKAEVPAS